MISLYSGLMSAVYTYLHVKFINVNFAEYTIDMLRAKWAAAGLGEPQMAQAERMTRMMLAPGRPGDARAGVHGDRSARVLSLIIAAMIADASKAARRRPSPRPDPTRAPAGRDAARARR